MALQTSYQTDLIEAGIDEAGRGCYAGPVFAAAVILPPGFYHPLLNDSKQVKEKQRYELREVIEKQAIAFAVAAVNEAEIDRINILQATWTAMHQAIARLSTPPGFLLIDGNRFRPFSGIPHRCIVQGDALYASIAAASILAKTYRDDYMNQLHSIYPQYGWEKNKGYGTKIHRDAILQHGLCEYHRKSFQINPAAGTLF
ncbi:ribonuclease HII [Flavihumibacter sp. CACIAM 22H1]|uniref:ribonuclease HII n=1 Tax=Flavihumibacter sp. CACIAM 22H1 TaxID=1812911 RepID=UPI0007A83465|nr:ribonuclease HII [Flavihumibacter sp. CACIAM 22H1]KYP16396.1 MAG: ribonuclease HII [Flavihumibacter sp. CACIAM 22H1]